MEQEELDIIELENEDGEVMELRVARYFFYNGEEYVLLSDDLESDDNEEASHYIMQVVQVEGEEEMEEFVPITDEALLEKLACAVEKVYEDEDNE